VISNLANNPALSLVLGLVGLAELVLFIMFWVKIAGLSAQLAAPPRHRGRDRDYDGDDDDNPDDDYPDRNPKGTPSESIRPEDPGRYR
jgi:hypothetical protein